MYRIMIVFALAGMTFFAGCGKKTAITIPESLIGTTWDGNNGGVERFSLVFAADKCTLTKSAPSQEDEVRVFDYRYERPNLEMTDVSNPEKKLTGKIYTDSESYLCLRLNNADNSVVLGSWIVK